MDLWVTEKWTGNSVRYDHAFASVGNEGYLTVYRLKSDSEKKEITEEVVAQYAPGAWLNWKTENAN